MIKIAVILMCVGVALAGHPLYGSPECKQVLATPCDSYSYEPVCVHNGNHYTTYRNSCEFAHGICSHHGHSVTAEYTGVCKN